MGTEVRDSGANDEEPVAVTCKQQMKIFANKMNLKTLFAPSTIGAIIGFIVGIIAPVRRLLIGENAVLHVIQDSASLLGDGAIRTVSLVMGGNLTKGLKESQDDAPVGKFICKVVLLLQFAVPPAMNISTISDKVVVRIVECGSSDASFLQAI